MLCSTHTHTHAHTHTHTLSACQMTNVCVQVDPDGLMEFIACRLIALDKCPGGVGEIVRRIIGKAVLAQ